VTSRTIGERVFAASFLNPTGGFYAEYVCVDADLVAPIPAGMSTSQAAVMGGVGMTALRGLQDALDVRSGETLLIHGASGAMGHLAVQLGKRLGARVLAVASGEDGIALAARAGADLSIDGRAEQVADGARRVSADGLDAALLTAGGPEADATVATVRPGGRAAYPTGVQPEPASTPGVEPQAFNGEPTRSSLNGSWRSSATGRSTCTSRTSSRSIRSQPHITPCAITTWASWRSPSAEALPAAARAP